MKIILSILLVVASLFPLTSFAKRSHNYDFNDFSATKKILKKHLDLFEYKTVYCPCKVIDSKRVDTKSCGYKVQKDYARSSRLEFEHIVAAENFGQSFSEWRNGSPLCHGKKGRKCAGTNPEFAKIEGDIYNLYPIIGELNGLRSNYQMAELTSSDYDFGGCRVKLADRKFTPENEYKGIVARTYMNMEARYPGRGIISEKNKKLFQAWNKMYPVTKLECLRWKKFKPFAGYDHLFVKECK